MVVGQLGRKIAWNFLLTRSSAISQVPVLGILDKMLKSAFDHGRPLTAISTSPPERSAHNEGITSEYQYRTTYGSIMDNQRIAEDPVEDSIFEKLVIASVSSSDITFFSKNSEGHNPPRCRSISSSSVASSYRPGQHYD